MSLSDFLRPHFRRIHDSLNKSCEGLSLEQFHWCPADGSNHIAFCYWHYARSEDNLVRWVFQDHRPTVWLEEGWHERFGLDKINQGTGMPYEQARAIRFPSIEEIMTYASHSWESTDQYLASATDEDLLKVMQGSYRRGSTIADILGTALTHGAGHLGQVWTTRGFMGKGDGSPI